MPPHTGPTKQRTRQHMIADLSVNHFERFVIEAGYTAQRFTSDYGYDLVVMTFDDDGYVEREPFYVQLKASESLPRVGRGYAHDLDVRDYNLWMSERFPVILVLYDVSRRRAYWVHIQGHFRDDSLRPRDGAQTVRVHVPIRQSVTRQAVGVMRQLKLDTTLRLSRESNDG